MLLVPSASALDPSRTISQYIHEHWGADRGFLGGAIYAVGQSSDGYLWIGTERGLVRFDGFDFSLIQRPIPGALPLGPVRGLVPDEEGNLWIRVDGPRLLRYHEGHFQNMFAEDDLGLRAVTAMSLDKQGHLLLSGIGNHTFRYRNGKFETVANATEAPGTVLSIAETRDHRVWMGTRDDGLFRSSDGHLTNVARELVDEKIDVLLPSDAGGLWIGTDRGLFFSDGNGLARPDVPASAGPLQILALCKDREANLWAGTDHGLIRITPAGVVSIDLLSQGLGNAVTAIAEDSDGDIWYGGSQGLERLRDGMFTTYSIAQGLPSENNGPVYIDSEGRTWFAPLSGGLYWLKQGYIGHVGLDSLDHDIVYSISGGDGEIWVGRQHGGLTQLTDKNGDFAAHTYTQADGLAQNSVYSVHRNHDGTVWAGTVSGGVSRLKNGAFTNYSVADGLGSNSIDSIVEGFDGKMWFATPAGLACFADGQWSNRTIRDSLPSPDVRSIFEDSKHLLWIATSGGLAFLSSGQVQVPHNLPNALREQVFGIAEGQRGFLWVATSDHVLQVNRDRLAAGELEEMDVRSYGITDGLKGVEAARRDRSMVADALGRVWVSLNHGLAVADPKLGIGNAVPVVARIESVSIGNAEISLQQPPKIAAGSEGITFNFIGSSLAAPDRVRFRYKLDGSDKEWSGIVALRQVVYNHLGPGSYRFRVVASSADGLWNGSETTFPFVIEPAFWQTWWFGIACFTACLLGIAGLYRLRMYHLTRRLNDRFQERLAERTRIAQELHDTLLQGVLSASLQLDVAEDQLPEGSPTKPLLKRILQLMGKVTEEGRSALRGLRASDTDNASLEAAFSRMRQEFALDERVGYRIIVNSVARPLRPAIRDDVYRIGREALVNAFVHAGANSIEIEVEYASRYLMLLVRDDGRGIDPQVLHSGVDGHWGLPGMRERSEGIGATLKLRSRVGAGTEVELTVPAAIAFADAAPGSIMSQWLHWLRREVQDPGEGQGKANR
ncbi:MAG TPA: two-component regulator propeller domain-containing protein [Acidobacteriaceae bacterium]|jgi:ligand-binding sensor domain-containing protein|nr:two-component regulator propeller domain-containing protein [Acidobacteriaceae bacterium]